MNVKMLCLAGLIAAALPAAAFADVAAELATAKTHAGRAAKAPALAQVQMHMHHALNCLVGPKGMGFDATQANPCAKEGNGAMADATDAAQKAMISTTVSKLEAGLKLTDVSAAQSAATDAAASITP